MLTVEAHATDEVGMPEGANVGFGAFHVRVPNIRPIRSRYESVLVNQTSENVPSSKLRGVGIVDRIRRNPRMERCLLVE